ELPEGGLKEAAALLVESGCGRARKGSHQGWKLHGSCRLWSSSLGPGDPEPHRGVGPLRPRFVLTDHALEGVALEERHAEDRVARASDDADHIRRQNVEILHSRAAAEEDPGVSARFCAGAMQQLDQSPSNERIVADAVVGAHV